MLSTMPRIAPQQLHALRKQGDDITLIDVRTPLEYRSGHVPGAKLLPLDRMTPEALSGQLPRAELGREQPLYLTCRSGLRAEQAAERLQAAGYPNLVLLEGGTEAWEKTGLPLRRCGRTISLERQVQIAIGTLLVLKVFFGFTVHELFFAVVALIGAGLIVAGTTRWCGVAQLLARLPWNRQGDCLEQSATSLPTR
jgi:rhodanese-related sulfurtransferase